MLLATIPNSQSILAAFRFKSSRSWTWIIRHAYFSKPVDRGRRPTVGTSRQDHRHLPIVDVSRPATDRSAISMRTDQTFRDTKSCSTAEDVMKTILPSVALPAQRQFRLNVHQWYKSSQRAARKKLSVVFSQPGESPILSQPEGGDKNFSQEERLCLTKNRGGGKKKPVIGRTRRKTKYSFPGQA